MRSRITILFSLFLIATSAVAEDRWVLISGTVGVFHTDARVFNPSFDKDIQVTARFLPTDAPNNNSVISGPGSTFTVPKRSMHILNDVTSALFGSSALGAIVFSSDDPFEASTRIYAQMPDGTLGQFGPGLAAGLARTKGAILQMKNNGAPGQQGTFRTNIGVVNVNNQETVIEWRLYDRNNAVVATGTTTLPPYGVTPPLLMTSDRWFQPAPSGADLSDAWVSFSATNPVFAYASVLDNGTTDQTFVPAVDDVGVAPPPQQRTHTFDVTLDNWSITFSPAPSGIVVGDEVTLRIRTADGFHGFQVSGPGAVVVPNTMPSGNVVERTFTASTTGTYFYFCTVSSCGTSSQHNSMQGSFDVGASSPGTGPRY